MTNLHPAPGTALFSSGKAQCAERIGVSRSTLRRLRKEHLHSPIDWHMVDAAVVLTLTSLPKVEALIAAATSPQPGALPPPRRRAPPWRCLQARYPSGSSWS